MREAALETFVIHCFQIALYDAAVRTAGARSLFTMSAIQVGDTSRRYKSAIQVGDTSRRYKSAIL